MTTHYDALRLETEKIKALAELLVEALENREDLPAGLVVVAQSIVERVAIVNEKAKALVMQRAAGESGASS
jgi:hypothetical protein